MNTRDRITYIMEHTSKPIALTGRFYLIDGGTRTEISESKARELIAQSYAEQHRDFPQFDGANVSLGANQSVRFEADRIA